MGNQPLFLPILVVILWGGVVSSWGELLPQTSSFSRGFWESRNIALRVKRHREGSKWFHGTTSLSRVSPASNFGCWNRWKSLRISRYGESQPFSPLVAQRKEPCYEGASQSLLLKDMGLHQAWEKGINSQLLAALPRTARGACVYLCLLLNMWWKVWHPSRQAGLSGLGFGCRQGFHVSIIKYHELHYSQQRSTIVRMVSSYFRSTNINILWDILIILEVLKFRAQEWVNPLLPWLSGP